MACAYNLGLLLVESDKLNEAIKYFQLAIKFIQTSTISSNIASIYNMLAETYFKLGQYTNAENFYTKALAASSKHISAYVNMAKLRLFFISFSYAIISSIFFLIFFIFSFIKIVYFEKIT